MSYTVALPDGRTVEFPDSVSREQAAEIIRSQLGIGEGKTGLGAALGKGVESTLSQLRSGVSGLLGSPEEAAKAGVERGEKIGKEYADQVSLEKVKEAYKRGLLPAAGEVAKQVPLAVLEQLPNLASMAGGARLGAMLGAPLGPVGALVGGGVGAVAPSFLQQFGGNIERQAQEQAKAGKPTEIDRQAALAAAAPQAALDVAGSFIPLGGRLVSKLTGIPEQALLGRSAAQVQKLADEKLLAVVAKGTAKGAAFEIPTEIAQQVLERAQAGLSLTDEDALKEYGETAYQVGLLGPLGAAGRLSERAGARQEVARTQALEKRQAQLQQLQLDEQAQQQKEADEQAEEARRQTVPYALEAEQKWQGLLQQRTDLQARARAKIDQNDPLAVADKQEANKQLQALVKSPEYKDALAEIRRVQPILAPVLAQRKAQAEQAEARKQAQAAQAEAQQKADEQRYMQAAAEKQEQAQAELDARMQAERFAGPMQQQDLFGAIAPTTPQPSTLEYQTPTGASVKPVSEEIEPAAPNRAIEFAQKQQELAKLLEAHTQEESAAAAKLDLPALEQLAKKRALLQNEQEYVTKQLELLGGVPSTDAAANIAKKLDKAKSALQALAGPGYDAAKADKLRTQITELTAKLQEAGGVQQALDMGPAIRPQVTPTLSEYYADYAKKRLAQATPPVAGAESEEQAYLEQQRKEAEAVEATAAAEAERRARISPEVLALRRMGARSPGLTTQINQLLAEAGADKPTSSAVIGQMLADIETQPLVADAKERHDKLLAVRDAQKLMDKRRVLLVRANAKPDPTDRVAIAQAVDAANQLRALTASPEYKDALTDIRDFTQGADRLSPEQVEGLNADIIKAQKAYDTAATTALKNRLSLSTQYPGETAQQAEVTRVPGEKPAKPAAAPKSPEGLKARIEAVLQREDLSDEARTMLNRMAALLPAPTAGITNLFDEQLRRIESGADEVTKEGVPKTGVRQALPIKRVPLTTDKAGPISKTGVPVSVAPPTKAEDVDIQRQRSRQKVQQAAYDAAIKQGLSPAEARKAAQAAVSQAPDAEYEAKYHADVAAGTAPEVAASKAYKLSSRKRQKMYNDLLAQGVEPLPAAKQTLAADKTVAQTEGERVTAEFGAPVVGKRTDVAEPTTVRGPSAGKRVGMSLAPQLETAISNIEKGRARKQELIKQRAAQATEATRAEQEKQAAQQRVVRDAQEALAKHTQAIPALEQKIKALTQSVGDMLANQQEYEAAESIASAETPKRIKKGHNALVAANNELMVSSVMDHMKAAGFVERLQTIKRELEAQTGGNHKVRHERKKQIAGLTKDIEQAQSRTLALEQQLKKIEETLRLAEATETARLQVVWAHKNLAGLREKAPFPYQLEEAATELADAEKAFAASKKAVLDSLETLGKERRREEGIQAAADREAREQASADARRAEQEFLEAKDIGGWRYYMITDAKRLANENPLPRIAITAKDRAELKKSPDRVMRGIRSRISTLEDAIKAKMDRTRGFMIANHEDVKRFKALQEKYENTKSADERAAMLPELEQARAAADRVTNRIQSASKGVMWVGFEKDRQDLQRAYQDEKAFQDFIDSGAFRKEFETAPKLIQSAEMKRNAAEEQRAAAAAEAATRAGSPETTGEALTRSETAKAREKQKTAYSSKGVGQAELSAADAEALKIAKDKKQAGQALTKREQTLLDREANQTRNITYGLVVAIKNKPAAERTEVENLILEQWKEANPKSEEAAKQRAFARLETKAKAVLNKAKDKRTDADKDVLAKYAEALAEQTAAEETETEALTEEDVGDEDALSSDDLVLQKAVQGPVIDLTPTAIEALRKNDLIGALTDVSRSSKIKLNQVVARRLLHLLRTTDVRVLDDLKNDRGETVYGAASADGTSVYINGKIGLNEETLLHEAVHAATERILQMPESQLDADQRAAKRELQALFEAVQNGDFVTSENARSSLSEFVAEALSNNVLQAQLSTKAWTLRNMWDSLKRILLNMLGIKTPATMLDAAIAATDVLFTSPVVPAKPNTKLSYRPTVAYATPGLAAAGEIGDKFIAKNRSAVDQVRAASGGFLGLETALVDRFAALEKLSKLMPSLKGSQMMYYARFYDQRMNLVAQSVANGALQRVEKRRPDGQKEYVIESTDGASLRGVVETLKEAKELTGSVDASSRLFTLYLSAIRAQDKGFDALHLGDSLTPADLTQALNEIRKTPGLEEIFKRAKQEYNDYNRGLISFAVSAGAIPKATASRLLKENDYIPWYRERGGVAEMVIGKETPIKIGNVTEQPYLHELLGSGKPILDFMVSSVQNTNMLTDMALRNLLTKNAVMELAEMGLAKIGRKPISGPTVVRFRVEPQDDKDNGERYALMDTDKAGVPADILVKGMEGIPTQLPAAVRLLSMPATFIRKAVTASPLYAAKQIFRDSMAAPLLAGADFMPVRGALKEIGSATKKTLERRGVTGGQVFTGTSEDLSKILRDIANDKSGMHWTSLLSKAEAMSMGADALTRRAQYNSYIEQGLSEMEATLMALESMNFTKRGASPSIHWVNSMVPFFNAQIQSLAVLYKAMTGKMPFNEKLKIQEKLLTRGAMVAGTTLAYTAAMQDDEAYKNATPDQKYGNWFVRLPGVDEPLRLPIPFEIGYVFKALPEAMFNIMKNEHGDEEAFKAFNQILIQLIPGGTSMPTVEYGRAKVPIPLPIPQALRPAIELGMGKSFFTGRDILSTHEKSLLPEAQFRENTSELAKSVGRLAGVSPIALEELVRGYTGTMGLAMVQAVSLGMPASESPEKAVKRLSDMPVVGGAFQPNDAGGIINNVYERMTELEKVKKTVNDYVARGEKAKALELVNARSNEFAAAQVADYYVSTMRKLTQYETAIRASDMPEERKRKELDEVRKMKIEFSEMVRQATDKTTPR